MKCFKQLIKPHITASLPASHDPHQFAYHPNRSIEDAISTTLHSVITDCLCQNPVHRFLLSIQYHHPQRLMEKLLLVGLNAATCLWIRDFLTERPQSVRVRNNTSNSITLSTGSPQGFVLSLLLVTHDCASRHQGNQIVKFEDDNTVVGLIHKNEESMYREEV